MGFFDKLKNMFKGKKEEEVKTESENKECSCCDKEKAVRSEEGSASEEGGGD